MAQSEHLPIYKAAYDLCLYFEQIVRNFSRYHKYSLGQELREGARRVLKLVVRANARRDRAAVLLEIREEVEELKVLLFVKRTLRCRHYVRYVDDMVLLGDRDELLCWRGEIERFLHSRLRLSLRAEGKEPVRLGCGIDFVGWKTWWNHRVPRRLTLSRMRERVRSFEQRNVRRAFGGLGQHIALGGQRAGSVERLRESLASYSGHLRHGAAWGAWNGAWAECGWLGLVFRRKGWAFEPRWPERQQILRFRDRYAALLRGAGSDCLVFERVGRYVEFYGPQRLLAERVLGLKRVWLPRAGYGLVAGFPVWLEGRFAKRALRSGLAVVSPAPSAARPYPSQSRSPRSRVPQQRLCAPPAASGLSPAVRRAAEAEARQWDGAV